MRTDETPGDRRQRRRAETDRASASRRGSPSDRPISAIAAILPVSESRIAETADRGRARPLCRGGRGLAQTAAQAEGASRGAARLRRRRDRLSARRASRDAVQFAPGPRRRPSASPARGSMPSARSQIEIDEIAKSFAAMRDPYLAARIDDIRVVGTRLIRNLIKKPYVAYSSLTGGAIILAEELTPADTALMDPRRIGGFATESRRAPRAIPRSWRARSACRRCSGVPGLLDHARAEAPVIDRRHRGHGHPRPAPETIARLQGAAQEAGARAAPSDAAAPAAGGDPRRRRDRPRGQSRTAGRARAGAGQRRDGAGPRAHRIPVHEPRRSAGRGRAVRSFFAALVRGMEGRPVTLRTFDLGGDKLARGAGRHMSPSAANPALGLRAIRLSLKDRRLLDPQLAAMLRAAARRAAAHPAADDLDRRRDPPRARGDGAGRPPAAAARRALPEPLPPLGAMIEVPGAALAADALAARGRFLRDRHQRPHPIHAGDRPQRRAGRPSLQPAAPGGAAADPIRGRGGGAARHPDQHLRRDGRRPALCRAAARPRAARTCRWRRATSRGSSSASATSTWSPRRRRARAIMDQSDTEPHRRPARRFQRDRPSAEPDELSALPSAAI